MKNNLFRIKRQYYGSNQILYVIQRRFLFFFWIPVENSYNELLSASSREDAEAQLKYYLSQKDIIQKDITYYLPYQDKLISGTSSKEVKKKIKLKAFL